MENEKNRSDLILPITLSQLSEFNYMALGGNCETALNGAESIINQIDETDELEIPKLEDYKEELVKLAYRGGLKRGKELLKERSYEKLSDLTNSVIEFGNKWVESAVPEKFYELRDRAEENLE